MTWLPSLSIKRRLTVLMMLISFIAITLVSLTIVLYQRAWQTREMVRRFSDLAGVVGLNSTAALAFHDPQAATATLKALAGEEELISATLYNKEGQVFAHYAKREDRAAACPHRAFPQVSGPEGLPVSEGSCFLPDRLAVWKPIRLEGEILGCLYLEAGLRQLRASLGGSLKIALLAMLMTLCGTYPLSLAFQKTISRPILELARTMKTVSRDQIFSVRAEKERSDELGELIDCFNDMLVQIQKRDEALARQREHLEEEVTRRTAELFRANQELSQTIQELRESEQHLTLLMEKLSAGVVVVEAQSHRLVYANPYAAQILGVSREELKGAACQQFFCHGKTKPCAAPGEPSLPDREEDHLINSRGELVPILRSIVPIQRKGHLYFIQTFFDLTELKKVEAELRQSKEAAEAASRAKSQFLANMSHEIRTPLHGILGMTDLLLTTPLSEAQQRFIVTVRNATLTLVNLLQDLLDFSKIEAGKLALEHLDFDLPLAVEEVVEMFAEAAHAKGLEYLCIVAPEVPRTVKGDPLRLRQVLMNLLSNAIKYTHHGEIITRVSVRQDTGEKTVVLFEVQDTGVGIEPEVQKRVFEDFYQADGSTTRKFGGSGLGLAISQKLVQLMGGEIGLTSTPGQGSRFWFTLGFPRDGAQAGLPANHNVLLKGVKALVVDNNHTSRTILTQQLAYWGLESRAVGKAVEALVILEQAVAQGQPYQLAIIDQNLPDLDGVTLARTIKARPPLASVQLLLLLSTEPWGSPEEIGAPEVDASLRKPFRLSHLYNAILALLARFTQDRLAELPKPDQTEAAGVFDGYVLVVEDNPVNQEVVRAMLEYLGCRVELAASGREALDVLAHRNFDLVFMDCQMPDLDGYEVTRLFRRREQEQGQTGRTPVVALTAHALESERRKCLDAGMDDYLSKPFTLEQLQRLLEVWLQRKTQVAPGSPTTLSRRGEETEAIGAAASRPALDARTLANLRALEDKGSPGLLSRLIRSFYTDSKGFLEELAKAAEEENGEALMRLAHRFKSGSINLGAVELAELLKKLEHLARQRDLEEAKVLLPRILQEHARVVSTLRQEYPEMES
uniref:Sensory/regulatory protein RpfC n=1 Tax=Desulfobacca acetoxidans TaxID=60893 RepID=A0A7C5ELZ4_9BACT